MGLSLLSLTMASVALSALAQMSLKWSMSTPIVQRAQKNVARAQSARWRSVCAQKRDTVAD
jgi:hypothetical protein